MNSRLMQYSVLALMAGLILIPSIAKAGLVNLTSSRDFQTPANITADASTQLTGLASLAAFRAATPANRYVYSFNPWPQDATSLAANSYAFQFDLNGGGTANQTVTLSTTNPWPSYKLGETFPGNVGSSSPSALTGFGDIGWGGSLSGQTYTFVSPVSAVGMVFRCSTAYNLKKSSGYPVSYTLTNGTTVNLGTSGAVGASMAANTNTFVGVVDSSGLGITSITINITGTASQGQVNLTMDDLAFVMQTAPPASTVISLADSDDFAVPGNITASASMQLAGLSSLADMRATNPLSRYIYSFEHWPVANANLGVKSYTYQFDLNGDGETDENVTVTQANPWAYYLTWTNLGSATSSPNYSLGGLGDIGWSGGGWATHTFAFSNPVSSVGFVYRSPSNFYLKKNVYNANDYPVSYTLTDGTVVNLGSVGVSGATITGTVNTYVGVADTTGKGISSITTRVQGSASGASQFPYIDDLAFNVAKNPPIPGQGPPAGNWTLTFDDEFDGSALNSAIWTKGMRWAGVINNELQGYVPENVTVGGGYCTITTEKRTVQNTDMTGYKGQTMSYASGCLQTYNKWTQTYGYFEARMKMPGGSGGTWPAFWLLPDRGAGSATLNQRVAVGNSIDGVTIPMGNEIDVLEYISHWESTVTGIGAAHSGYFWGYGSGQSWGNYAQLNQGAGPQFPVLNQDSQFHNYGVYWGPGVMKFYVDGTLVLNRADATNIGVCPEYMILNCALSTNAWTTTLTGTQIDAGLPATTVIDYVRVYSGTPSP